MSKVIEFIVKALDDGQTTEMKEIKWPSFNQKQISLPLFITTAWIIPFAGAILAGIFMDVNSREFNIVILPLLVNTLIILFLLLRLFALSKKEWLLISGLSIGMVLLSLLLRVVVFPIG